MSQDPPFLSTVAARRYLDTLTRSAGVQADCVADVGPEMQVFARTARNVGADLLIVDQTAHGISLDVPSLAKRAGCTVLTSNTEFSREKLRRMKIDRQASVRGPALVSVRGRFVAK
jgi:hypothetical protein